jgi:hypothetical protein
MHKSDHTISGAIAQIISRANYDDSMFLIALILPDKTGTCVTESALFLAIAGK